MWVLADAWGLRGKFVLFGPAHLGVFAVLATVLVVMVRVARDGRRVRLSWNLEVALAMVLLWSFPSKVLARYYGDMAAAAPLLPMHFCDWAAAAGFFALVFRSERMAELTYFWGLAGTLQGLVTPDLEVGFPHPAWFAFFQLHGAVVLVALYLVIGRGWRPRKWAVLRVFVLGNLYLLAAGLVNLLSAGSNYGFLRAKPASGSLMDALGPWPVYILGMQGLALVILTLLDLPFWRGRRRAIERVRGGGEPGAGNP